MILSFVGTLLTVSPDKRNIGDKEGRRLHCYNYCRSVKHDLKKFSTLHSDNWFSDFMKWDLLLILTLDLTRSIGSVDF